MRCRRCGDYYGPNDDLTAGVQAKDEDWQAAGGKCYLCFLRGMFDLYGGWLEPAFTVGGKTYLASGVVDASEEGGEVMATKANSNPAQQATHYTADEIAQAIAEYDKARHSKPMLPPDERQRKVSVFRDLLTGELSAWVEVVEA